MNLKLTDFKPNLDFDLFTIQHSPSPPTARPTPTHERRPGLVPVRHPGRPSDRRRCSIKTILLDQIFGVDKDMALAPTNTFHLGFWFNNPADARVRLHRRHAVQR